MEVKYQTVRHDGTDERSHSPYLDVSTVGRKVHLHHEAGDVPAAVDAVQLRAERQVVEVDCILSGAHGQVARVWAEPTYRTSADLLCRV